MPDTTTSPAFPGPGTSGTGASSTERSTGYYTFVLVVVLLLAEATTLTAVIFYNALRFMSPPFTSAELPWIASISLLIGAAFQPLVGKLADQFGFRRLVVFVALLFVAGSLIGALTSSFALIMVARVLQGGIIAMPGAVFSFLRSFFPKRMVPVLIGMNMTGIGVAGAAGPLLSGVLISAFSYHSIFWFCLIYMMIVAPATLLVLSKGGIPARTRTRTRIDLPGSLLVTIGVGALLLSFTEGPERGWGSPLVAILFAITAVAVAAFVITELRTREPMIDIRLLTHHALRDSLAVAFFTAIPIAAWQYLFPELLSPVRAAGTNYGFGLTALQIGLVNLPFGAVSAFAGPLGGILCKRFSPRTIMMWSAGLGTVTCVGVGFWHSDLWEIVVWALLMGAVFGLYFAAGPNLVIDAVPERLTGVSTGILSVASSLPNSAMPVVVATVLSANLLRIDPVTHAPVYSSNGYLYVYLLLAAGSLIGLGIAARMRHGRQAAAGGLADDLVPVTASRDVVMEN
jgi:MFS family permease